MPFRWCSGGRLGWAYAGCGALSPTSPVTTELSTLGMIHMARIGIAAYLQQGNSSLYLFVNSGPYSDSNLVPVGVVAAGGLGFEAAARGGTALSLEAGLSRFFPAVFAGGFIEVRLAWGFRF